jgi:competence protein ComEC
LLPAAAASATAAADSHAGWLRLTSLDVAQGDATLIRWPDGATLMVDAGGSLAGTYDIGARIVSPALWALGLRRLDILALTHGDRDHIGGASAVLQDFRPRYVWEGVPVPTSALLAALRQQAAAQGARWHTVHASAPSDARADGTPAVRLRVWNPPADTAAADAFQRATVRNDDSIVLEIPFGRVSIILPGDIGPDVERRLAADLSSGPGILPAPAMLRILKAAHHGSGRSSTAAFLRALAPRIAIISAGRGNRFGHPAPAALDRLHAIGAAIFRTDEDGAIQIDTDGIAVYVTTCSGRTLRLAVP